MLDLDHNITYINRTVPDLTIEDVIGTPIYDFLPDESKTKMKKNLEFVAETAEEIQIETEYRTIKGESRTFQSFIGPVNSSNKVIGLTVVSRDISI